MSFLGRILDRVLPLTDPPPIPSLDELPDDPPPQPLERRCNTCGVTKHIVEFRIAPGRKGREYRRNVCRDCENAGRVQRRETSPIPPPSPASEVAPASEVDSFPGEDTCPGVPEPPRNVSAAEPSRVRTYVVVSDVHVPYEDHVCTEAVGALARDIGADGFVIAGDFLDLLEISRHSAGSVAQLEGRRVSDTFDAANALLDQWEKCAPLLHYLDGNHEDRIRRWMAHGDNAVWQGDVGTDIGARLRLRERGCQYHEGESAVRLGKLLVTHGRWTNKYHANKHLDEYRHSVMYGHTHSPQTLFASAHGAQQVAIGIGHLADPDSPAMSYARKPNRWCQGFALVHVMPDESFRAVPLNFWHGSFVYAGKVYGRAP